MILFSVFRRRRVVHGGERRCRAGFITLSGTSGCCDDEATTHNVPNEIRSAFGRVDFFETRLDREAVLAFRVHELRRA